MEIRIKDLSYKNIFNHLNIDINCNKITALIGKNGSGKTTLLDLIYGIYKDFDGESIINSKNMNKNTKTKDILHIRKAMGYIRQDLDNDLFNINIFEDIRYGQKEISNSKLNELLITFDLDEDILKKNYMDLSSGERKKILLIKMFVQNKSILLLDDPTKDLDSKSISNLIKLLKREKRNNKIVIISSMDSDFLISLADNFIIIDNGKIKLSNDKYEVFSNIQLLNRLDIEIPNVISIKNRAAERNIKLMYRDNINDILKDIYRNV